MSGRSQAPFLRITELTVLTVLPSLAFLKSVPGIFLGALKVPSRSSLPRRLAPIQARRAPLSGTELAKSVGFNLSMKHVARSSLRPAAS